MEYRILGPVEVLRDDGERVVLDGTKQRTVLAALLLSGPNLLSDARLSEFLWGTRPPATSTAQIYTYVSRLRKLLGREVTIGRRSPGYVLDIGDGRLDLAEFEQHVRLGQDALGAARCEEAVRHLRRALNLWRGPALVDVAESLAAEEDAGCRSCGWSRSKASWRANWCWAGTRGSPRSCSGWCACTRCASGSARS